MAILVEICANDRALTRFHLQMDACCDALEQRLQEGGCRKQEIRGALRHPK
jgi:hypothetical protein